MWFTDRVAVVTGAASGIGGDLRVLLGPETFVVDWGKRRAPVRTQHVIAWLSRRLRPRLDPEATRAS